MGDILLSRFFPFLFFIVNVNSSQRKKLGPLCHLIVAPSSGGIHGDTTTPGPGPDRQAVGSAPTAPRCVGARARRLNGTQPTPLLNCRKKNTKQNQQRKKWVERNIRRLRLRMRWEVGLKLGSEPWSTSSHCGGWYAAWHIVNMHRRGGKDPN